MNGLFILSGVNMKLSAFKSFSRYSIYAILVLFTLIFNSCKEDNNPVETKFNETGTKAILIVVENSFNLPADVSQIYPMIKSSMDSVFSVLFEVPYENLKDKDLVQILDLYGEAWQINQIKAVADSHYNKVVVLTDDLDNYTNFIDTLKYLSDNYSAVDMILNIHGTTDKIKLGEELIESENITKDFYDKNIKIRALYQTCCYGSSTINDFTYYGILACNGCNGTNSITIYSSKYFLQNWCNGMTYRQSVENAYNQDINTIRSYAVAYPAIEQVFLSNDKLDASRQFVGGKYPDLLFKSLSIIK